MADVTTGLYMISAICGLVDAVCFQALASLAINPDWIVWGAMAANLKPMAADLGQSRRWRAPSLQFLGSIPNITGC